MSRHVASPSSLSNVALGAVLALASSAAAPPSSANELDGKDFADPFVVRDGTTYYAFATGAGGEHLQLASSTDLTAWKKLADPLPALPSWAAPSASLTWAPSVLRRGDRWVLYYTTRDAASDYQCISRATSTRVEGPYTDTSARPFICQTTLCGSIDPSPFVDATGRAYLTWKSDENSERCGTPSRIWAQRLTDDGLDVTAAAAVPLLAMDLPWEHPLVEGPSMIAKDGVIHLFYSANWYESASYGVGHATCGTPLGPCTKTSTKGAFVASSTTMLGPGGQELFDDANGATLMTYHAWTAPKATYASGGARSLRFARVTFESGRPTVHTTP